MTSNKNIVQPSYNSYQNSWNIPVNQNFANIDSALGGVQYFTLSSSTGIISVTSNVFVGAYPANTASFIPSVFYVSGSMSANTTLQIPSGIGGRWSIINTASGSATVYLNFKVSGGTSVALSAGINDVYSDGTNCWVNTGWQPGDTKFTFSQQLQPGWLKCYSQTLSTTAYPALFLAIGYTFGGSGTSFMLPPAAGRAFVCRDDMSGTAANVLPGYTLGVSGGEATHTLSTTEIPAHNHLDSGHAHTDSGHTHGGIPSINSSSGGGLSVTSFAIMNPTASGTSGISYANINTGYASIQNTGGGGSHNNIQPTIAANCFIKY